MVTIEVVSVTGGVDVAFSVLIVGRVGGFVCGFITFKYPICGFASVTVTLLYVPAGIVLMSSSVRSPFNLAKSTVCAPVSTETVLLFVSVTDNPVMSTWNDTTLGNGASVPVTNTDPDCGGTIGVPILPPPHPLMTTTKVHAQSALNHFMGFLIFISFRTFYPGGVRHTYRPVGIGTPFPGKKSQLTHQSKSFIFNHQQLFLVLISSPSHFFHDFSGTHTPLLQIFTFPILPLVLHSTRELLHLHEANYQHYVDYYDEVDYLRFWRGEKQLAN
jgi:putative effector of murein hydrolase LrgA (UPF0299 family)